MSRAQRRCSLALTATLALTGLVGSDIVLSSSVARASSGSGSGSGSGAAPTSSPAFDLPQKALRSSPKKVFAHYMPSLPVSFDNRAAAAPDYWSKNYLLPGGEKGIHARYGGLMRDAPSGRTPRTGDWRLANMEQEVRQAIAAGIDGFAVDLLTVHASDNLTNTKLLMKAAERVDPDFKIMLVPDMTTSTGKKSQAELAAALAPLAAGPAAFRLSDGRLVLSPFKADNVMKDEKGVVLQNHNAAWWKGFLSIMKKTHKIDVAFVPMFLDERPALKSFAPISYGMSLWGSRNPKHNDYTATGANSPLGRVRAVHDKGLIWMQPVSYQDVRPRSGIFDEAENTTNLRNTWQLAMRGKAEWVQLVTWNDYAEGSQFAPSEKHGWGPLDLNAYYLTQYKTGKAPAIVRDSVLLTHRLQPYAAKPSYPQSLLMKLRGGSSPARDTVEAVTLLTKASTVSITVGSTTKSCSVPAGVGICTVPLKAGKVSAKVVRNGSTTAAVTSPHAVTNTPSVQDLQYVSASSGREGTSAPKPSPQAPKPSTPTPKPKPRPIVVKVAPIADSYVNQRAAKKNYGKSRTLASRGTSGYQTYLKFDLPPTPRGKKLRSAVLTIHTSSQTSAGSKATHTVRLGGKAWKQRTLTWKKRPAGPSTKLGVIKGAKRPNTAYRTSLNSAAVGKLANARVTFRVTSAGRDLLRFWSTEQSKAGLRPQLVLTYS